MIAIVAPCFNEGLTVIIFLQRLQEVLARIDEQFHVIIVDDCSQDDSYERIAAFKFDAPNVKYSVIRLKFNMGHQGAIFQGLNKAHSLKADHTVIMDSDGEDDPEAIAQLVNYKDYEIVMVKRGKRSEGLIFRLSYLLYKLLFQMITQQTINFGNYCMIDNNIVERIKYTSFIHLPAYLLKQKARKTHITSNRGKRIDGKSKIGYKGLLMHAFKSMIEFGEDLLLLFLRLFVFIMIILVFAVGNMIYQKFITHTAILGWFSTLVTSLAILAMLCIGFFIIGVLLLNLIYQQNNRLLTKDIQQEL